MSLVAWLLVVLLLLCIGSAIGCLTYRWPIKLKADWEKEAKEYLGIEQDEVTVNPLLTSKRSLCPNCHKVLSIRDLIPVISYVFNGAKCRHCDQSISIRYPMIESLFCVMALPSFFMANDSVEILFLLLFWSSLYTGAIIDFENMFIPDETVLLGVFSAFALHLYMGSELSHYLLGAMVGYAMIYIVRFVYLQIKKVEGIGLGDASLMAAIGGMVGLPSLFHVLILGCAFGVIGHILSKNKQVPFAPSLVAAAAVVFYLPFL